MAARETVEQLLSQNPYKAETQVKDSFDYKPVLYEIVKDPSELDRRESLSETHDKFIERSEQILKLHH